MQNPRGDFLSRFWFSSLAFFPGVQIAFLHVHACTESASIHSAVCIRCTGDAGRERWQLKVFIKWFGGEQPQMELTAFKGKSSSSSTSSLVV